MVYVYLSKLSNFFSAHLLKICSYTSYNEPIYLFFKTNMSQQYITDTMVMVKPNLKNNILIETIITCIIYLLWIVNCKLHKTCRSSSNICSKLIIRTVSQYNQNKFRQLIYSACIKYVLNVTLFTSFITISIAFIDFWIDATIVLKVG